MLGPLRYKCNSRVSPAQVIDIFLMQINLHLVLLSSVQSLSRLWLCDPVDQHARPPCPSPTPRACSNSCPSCWWCHPTISSSVVPFSSSRQSCPASGFFPMSQFFTSGGRSIGVSASGSVFPVSIQDWFLLDWLVWSPCSPRDCQESSPTPQFKSINSLVLIFLYSPTLTLYRTTGKTIGLTRCTFVGKVMSLLSRDI